MPSRRIWSHQSLRWHDQSFDLVVCSYSLYFFTEVVPHIARVLKQGGRLLALTHSEESVREMLSLAGAAKDQSALLSLVRRFSAESGTEVLSPTFDRVERTDYPNSLRFEEGELEDLFTCLRFKFHFMSHWPESEPELHRLHTHDLEEKIACCGPVTLRKDDAAFWAGRPGGSR